MKRFFAGLPARLLSRLFLAAALSLLVSPGDSASRDKKEPPRVPLRKSHSTSFVVFPADCNANPPMLFGGKVLAEMDRCAAVAVRRLLYSSPKETRDAVTVSIENLTFRKPARIKDLVFVTADVDKIGKKSITLSVRVEREGPGGSARELLADGVFVFVAYDTEKAEAVEHGLEGR